MKEVRVSRFAALRNSSLILDDQTLVASSKSSDSFLEEAYLFFHINYPKFYKMDSLCKTAFVAAEALLRNSDLLKKYAPEEIGIVLSCKHSSLETDVKYAESMKTASSPSLFVYTLPNVASGEVSIRHGLKGETCCFVEDSFNAALHALYVNRLLAQGDVKCCVSGWVDFFQNKAEAFFYLAEYSDNDNYPVHQSKIIDNKYQSIWKS
jgi:3-oxoacyl-(acyl-carrier-protein) synthase